MNLITASKLKLIEQSSHYVSFSTHENSQLTLYILDDDIIRVRHLLNGEQRLDRTWLIVDENGQMPREGRQRDDLSPFPLPSFTTNQTTETVDIQTAGLGLRVYLDSCRIEWRNTDEQLFHADLKGYAYRYNTDGRDIFHYTQRFEGEHYYGFGERAGKLSKVGRRMRMLNLDAIGYSAKTTDPLYKHCSFYITYNPQLQLAYGILYDNLSTTTFDMGKEIDAYKGGPYRYYHAEDGDLDYYLIYGSTIEAVIEKYTKLIGRPMLPPKWSLGYLGSTMSYTEAEDAQEQLKQFSQLCQKHDIPCDMFHLSSGYTTNEQNERCVFTWNRSRIPDPQAMVDDFHAAGIRLSPNLKPHMLKTHPYYDDVAQQGGFIKKADKDSPQTSTIWSGGLNEMDAGSYLDFTSSAGYGWWKKQATEQLLNYGIDALWNDNNEYEVWEVAARCDGFGHPIPVNMIRPLQPLLMAHASYHALLEYYPNQRPFVVSRSGAAGIQRYAQTWSGDNTTSWNNMKYNVSMSLGSSLSGMPNNGNDVGGFFGPKPEPELLVRWVQSHIFHPRFSIHSWNFDKSATEAWMYPEVLDIIRDAIHLRYRLIPYFYSLLFESTQTGHPIMRPLVYHFPNDEQCHNASFDFLLGSHLLVATVLEKGAQSRSVYLPKGAMWCDFYTGDWYEGGQTITIPVEMETVPLFARDGGLISMGQVMPYIGAKADNVRQVFVYPHPQAGENTFALIEDDGVSFDYQAGVYTALNLRVRSTADTVELAIDTAPHNFNLPYEQIEFIFPIGDERSIVGGRDHWIDEMNRQHVMFPIV